MDIIPSLPGPRQRNTAGKRKRDGFDGLSTPIKRRRGRRLKPGKKLLNINAAETPSESISLLNLPVELLTEIFLLSANSELPTCCWYLYNVLHANPRLNPSDGPPLWLQHKFIANTNPSLSFAIQKCLRRRFFSSETLKAYLPVLAQGDTLENISIPMRCVLREAGATRELLLHSELFLNGVQLSKSSRNKALVYLSATRSHVDPDELFWSTTRHDEFEKAAILAAFKVACRKRFFDPRSGTFDYLVHRFGIDEDIGYQLYETAARKKDQQLIRALQRHGVRPGMDALKLITSN